MSRNVLFITGTRADFGKLKALMLAVNDSAHFSCKIFATGMHLLAKYGSTLNEIRKSGLSDIFPFMNQVEHDPMEATLANTIIGLSRYLHENAVDLIVVHGDRVEALAGAIAGSLRNVLVAHVEGGELSGTVDELMRHAISKMSHVHFVANETARKRLLQLGEDPRTIYVIGSPDIDAMLSDRLPSSEKAKARYDITFDKYAIAILHPVTTELDTQLAHAKTFVSALLESGRNYVVIYPNNDTGADYILAAYKGFAQSPRVKVFPSLRFEHFLTLLNNADFIIGNSSAGLHEAPFYGVPTINIGSRQNNRFHHCSVVNVPFDAAAILNEIAAVASAPRFEPSVHFGSGQSGVKFMEALNDSLWTLPRQKQFKDLP